MIVNEVQFKDEIDDKSLLTGERIKMSAHVCYMCLEKDSITAELLKACSKRVPYTMSNRCSLCVE